MSTAISTIGNILINVFSSFIYDKGKDFAQHRQIEKIEERINQWTEDFFSSHEEAVFEYSQFNNYITYQQPFDKIIQFVSDNTSSPVPEKEFVERFVCEAKEAIISSGRSCSVPQEMMIRDLFQGVLSLYKNILSESASNGEKLSIYLQRQSDFTTDSHLTKIDDTLQNIKNLIIESNELTDLETIAKIYHLLSDLIWEGRIDEVYSFLPILNGKSVDLETAIKIKLAVLSDYDLSIANPLALCCEITNPELRDDVFRLLILANFTTPNKIAPYVKAISNPALEKIAASIANGCMDSIISKTESVRNKIIYYHYTIADGLESEKWLVQRICLLRIDSMTAHNTSKAIESLVEQPTFVDRLYIWEHYFSEVICVDVNGEQIKSPEFQHFYEEIYGQTNHYVHAQLEIQKRFYILLLNTACILENNQVGDILSSIPKAISELPEIESFRLDLAIKDGTADLNAIADFVTCTGQYHLLIHYFEKLPDYQAALDIINDRRYLIKQSPLVFDLAVTATSQVNGKKDAFALLKEYEKDYSDYAMFWIKAYQVSVTNEDRQWIITSIISHGENRKLKIRGLIEQKTLADILIREKSYSKALGILDTIEQIGFGNPNITRMKLEALVNSGRPIDALAEIYKHYETLKDDDKILDLFLTISLNFKRPIREEVLFDSKQSNNFRVLMLTAEAEYIQKNIREAKKLAMRSMLMTPTDKEDLFGVAVKFFTENTPQDSKPPERITDETYFQAENLQNHSSATFCIYKENILPYSGYQWKEAQHIYIDDAVSMGFMRMSAGDTVELQDGPYKIIKIAPLSAFYVKVCMDSLLAQNRAWTVSGNNAEEMFRGIVELYQQNPDWNKQDFAQHYTDLSQPAFPIHILKRDTNLEYGQLMRVIVEDPSVIVRECIFPARDYKDREYVITYTALVELHKLNVDLKEFHNHILIPRSVVEEAIRETNSIVERNNKELVASMAVRNDNVEVIESTEDIKRENIRQAVSFKKYASELISMENTQDMIIPELQNTELSNLIGICDYDAVILAHTRNAVLITGEMMTAGLTGLEPVKADAAGIADFLCFLGLPVLKLLDIIRQMLKYRFNSAITPTVITYIKKSFDAATEEDKEAIRKAWADVLWIPEEIADNNFRNVLKPIFLDIIQLLKEGGEYLPHPIIYQFNIAALYYNGYKLDIYIQNGEIHCQLMPPHEENESQP